MTGKEVELKKFSVFSFTGEFTSDGKHQVDCVPSIWIKYDNELCSCVVKFPEPPYDEECIQLLEDLSRLRAEAPEDWLWWPIELRGHAESYEDGMKKTKLLKKQPYVYTSDSDTHAKAKADEITRALKKKSKRLTKTVEQILSESEHTASSEDEDDSSEDFESISSDEASNVTIKRRINPQKGKKSTIVSKKVRGKENRRQPKQYRSSTSLANEKSAGSTKIPSTATPQPKRRSAPNTTIRNSTFVESEKSVGSIGIPSTSTPQVKDNLPKKNNTSKRILETIEKQAANPNSVPKKIVLHFEKDADVQESSSDAPPVLEKTLVEFSEDTALIYQAIIKLKIQVTEVIEEMKTLRNSVERGLKTKVDQVSIITFVEKYQFEKLVTVADLEAFNKKLENEEYAKDLKMAMECLLDSDLQRTITGIIKKLFSRVLAMQCTAFRKSKDKFLLKGTRFYDLFFGFATQFHQTPSGRVLTEKEFYQTLSSCLTNAKDWEGNRKLRAIPPIALAPAAVVPDN